MPTDRKWLEYLSLSVVPSPDGTWRAYLIRKTTRPAAGHPRTLGQSRPVEIHGVNGAPIEDVLALVIAALQEAAQEAPPPPPRKSAEPEYAQPSLTDGCA